mmetsp:Transcript_7751/g.12900  ORF Transcript_7751/g.12900 Transcript_7751/m.12900 type:complete len:222 (-) Transcript_7751:687-1352(-)
MHHRRCPRKIRIVQTSVHFVGPTRANGAIDRKKRFARNSARLGPSPGEENIGRLMKRIGANDPDGMLTLGAYYEEGGHGLAIDDIAAVRLTLQAAETGHPFAIVCLANDWYYGRDAVQVNTQQAMRLATIAAKKGCIFGYSQLGIYSFDTNDDVEKATNLFSFAARRGESVSMTNLNKLSEGGDLHNIDIDGIRNAFEESLKLEWSEEREKAKGDVGIVEN